MVLCCVSDLMFSSRISTAARGLGVPLQCVRQPEDILPCVRDLKPALVIFDLHATRLRPLEAISSIKADPALGRVRTLGYASHVQTGVILAAREAGADEVLTRSAFTSRLAELLKVGLP